MRPWIYTQNPFINATRNSYVKTRHISIFHDSALNAAKADPDILTLYNRYHPVHEEYMETFDKWNTQGGIQQGDTLSLRQLLLALRNETIEEWDVKIQNVYTQGTSDYIRLLPDRRKPFQEGKYIDRIGAVKVLREALATHKTLEVLREKVAAYYDRLDAAQNLAISNISIAKDLSSNVEKTRLTICREQFVNLSSLIIKYPERPENVNIFFDLQTLRQKDQVEFTGHLAPNHIKKIVKRTFGENDQILLRNLGDTPLIFYLAQLKDMKPGSEVFEMNKGEQIVPASALGNLAHPFLKVFNPDPYLTGSFIMRIL
jgi:hypothetical protein